MNIIFQVEIINIKNFFIRVLKYRNGIFSKLIRKIGKTSVVG